MMKKSLKTLALFLACCTAAGVLDGCGGDSPSSSTPSSTPSSAASTGGDETPEIVNGAYTTGLPIAAEPITLKVAVVRQAGDQSSSTAVKPYAKRSVEDTGLNFEWVELITDIEEQISVMLASGDGMPDVFLGGITDDILAQNASLFAELQDLIPVYAPNIKAYYDENGIDWGLITNAEGKIYQLLSCMYYSEQSLTNNLPCINQTWLDNLGLQKPTTTDELYDVLKAFKEKDADGNGDVNNEIPLDFCQADWSAGIGLWGVSWGVSGVDGDNFYLVKDGKVAGTANTDAYRAYLEYFHKLYAEGLINTEGFSQTADQFNASIKAMNSGAYFKWAPQTQLTASAEAEQYAFLGKVTASGYEDEYAFPGNYEIAAGKGFTLSASSKHKEAALRWWDYLSSTDELRWLTNRGPDGLVVKQEEDGIVYLANPTDEEKQAILDKNDMADDFDISMTNASFYLDNYGPLILNNISYHAPQEGEYTSQGYWRQLAIREIQPELTQGMSKTVVPSSLTEEFTFTCEGLEDYIKAFRAEAIINGVTDDSWNKYLSELDGYNYDFYLEYYQKKLDGNFD